MPKHLKARGLYMVCRRIFLTKEVSHMPLSLIVEVRMSQRTSMSIQTIRKLAYERITSDNTKLWIPSVLQGWEKCDTLRNSVEKIIVSESSAYFYLIDLSCG